MGASALAQKKGRPKAAVEILAPHAQPPTKLSLALSDRPRRFEEGFECTHAKPPSESFPKDDLLRNSRRRSLFEIRAGARIELAVTFEAGRRNLPVVTLKHVA